MADYNYPDAPQRPERPVRPESQLAAAVISLALSDARSRARWLRREDRKSASQFLAGKDGWLAFWCEVAGLPLEQVRRMTQEALAWPHRPSRPKGQVLLPCSSRGPQGPSSAVELTARSA